MNGLIEAKRPSGAPLSSGESGGDQASALRAMIGRETACAVRLEPAAGPRDDGILRIAWLAERAYPELRGAIAGLAAGVGQRHGVRVAWDTPKGQPACNGRTDGLLMVCDSCASVAEALRQVRRAVAEGAGHGARCEALFGWIGVIGLTSEPPERCGLGASLRGLRETVEQLMGEPVQLLGVQRVPRRRGLWLNGGGRSRGRALSDELRQEIERFLDSWARSTCAIR